MSGLQASNIKRNAFRSAKRSGAFRVFAGTNPKPVEKTKFHFTRRNTNVFFDIKLYPHEKENALKPLRKRFCKDVQSGSRQDYEIPDFEPKELPGNSDGKTIYFVRDSK